MIHRRTSSAFVLALSALVAACTAAPDDSPVASSEASFDALPSLDAARAGGMLAYGAPASAPFEVTGGDVVVYTFEGSADDRVHVSVRPEPLSRAVPDLWLVDAAGNVIAAANDGTFLGATLPSGGTFRVVVREAMQRRARFTIALNAFVPTSPSGPLAWQIPATGGETMFALRVLSDTDAWAAGERGTLLHWDGTRLTRFETGSPDTLTAIWASGPNDVWAAGGSTLLRFDGTTFRRMARPSFATVSLQGSAPDDVWLLERSEDEYVVSRWDGERFVQRRDPQAAMSLVVRARDDAWLFAAGRETKGFRWNGLEWVEARAEANFSPFGSDVSIRSGTVLANGHVVVGGGFARRNTLHRWNGARWDNLLDYGLYGGDRVTSVWGTTEDDLWVVTGAKLHAPTGLAYGNRYERVTALTRDVHAVHGIVAGAPWAAGSGGQVWRREANDWRPLGERALACRTTHATGPSADAWVGCGREAVRRDASGWTRIPIEGLEGTDSVIALWAESPTSAWFATSRGAVIEVDASGPAPSSRLVAAASGTGIRSMWGASRADVWVVTTDGAMLRGGDGVPFTALPASSGVPTRALFVLGRVAGDVFAVGDGGAVSRFDGTSWSRVASGAGRGVYDVGVVGDRLHMVTSDGVHVSTGGEWQTLARGDLRAASVDANGTVDAIANDGRLGRFAGGAWTWRHAVPVGRMLRSDTGRLTLATESGLVDSRF